MKVHQLIIFVLISSQLLLVSILPSKVWALPPITDSINREQAARVSQSLAQTLMSPFCPGRTLEACPSPEAKKLRKEILVSALLGKGKDQIQEELISIYGYEILGTPEVGGFGLLGWAMPLLFLVIGLGMIVRLVVRIKNTRRPPFGHQAIFHTQSEYDRKQANDEIIAEVQKRMQLD